MTEWYGQNQAKEFFVVRVLSSFPSFLLLISFYFCFLALLVFRYVCLVNVLVVFCFKACYIAKFVVLKFYSSLGVFEFLS